jgi:two-component system chemotaxis sensor kinase CheA
MQQIDQFRTTFFQECDELLSSLEQHLSELVTSVDPTEPVNAAFRAVHSIKGGAGMFGFSRITAFSHLIESVLDRLRTGSLSINRDLVDRLLSATDVLSDLAHATRSGALLPDDFELGSAEELATFAEPVAPSQRHETQVSRPREEARPVSYRIEYMPGRDILRRGIEPQLVAKHLESLGKLSVECDASRLPSFEELDPACCELSWTYELVTTASETEIADAFEFVSPHCELTIARAAGPDPQPNEANAETSGDHRVTKAVSLQSSRRVNSIRVDLERVERLVDLVGEVTIAQAMVLQQLDQAIIDANPILYRALSQLSQLSRNLQEAVMTIRAQPIRSIFARMPRVAREVAQESGKRANLLTFGEETEIDKTIVEQLSDPLMHIVRNAVDHGIEGPEERRKAGKSASGTVQLSARQRGGRIIVEVSDDGRGINRERVLSKAVSLGLVDPEAQLSPREIDNLIFAPGLSTASALSEFSGRGVGMDVVSRNILGIGGRISIRSEPGVGTTTTIALPLTLAILDAMLVRVGPQSYFIPLNNLVESLVVDRRDIRTVPGSGRFVGVRGGQVKVFHLAEQLGVAEAEISARAQVMILEVETGAHVGFIVDEICGHRQVVVKNIDEHFTVLPGVSGATILGDGNVALILDVAQIAQRRPAPRPRPRLENSSLQFSEALAQ